MVLKQANTPNHLDRVDETAMAKSLNAMAMEIRAYCERPHHPEATPGVKSTAQSSWDYLAAQPEKPHCPIDCATSS